jgi:hypothetical protein
VTVVDDAVVDAAGPVWQPYAEADVGRSKAEALALRLGDISAATEVTARQADAISVYGAPGEQPPRGGGALALPRRQRPAAEPTEQDRLRRPGHRNPLVQVITLRPATGRTLSGKDHLADSG